MTVDPRNTQRDERILLAAVDIVRAHGLAGISRSVVADRARIAASSVSNYQRSRITNGPDKQTTGVMDRIRADVMRWGVDNADLTLVRAGIAASHPVALEAPEALRIAAITS